MQPILIHIPHSSPLIPNELRSQFCVDDDYLRDELLKLTDWFVDDLFNADGFDSIVFPVSRFVVDVERFAYKAAEPMSSVGMGVIYTNGTDGTPIRNTLKPQARERLFRCYYCPHHAYLNSWADDALAEYGACLVIDAHSFRSSPLPCDLDQEPERPDICVGVDHYHTPPELERCVVDRFRSFGYTVFVNKPSTGALVPSSVWKKDSRAWAIMIEINRALYMNEADGMRAANYDRVKEHVASVLDACREIIPSPAATKVQAQLTLEF
ncbi:MAG: N-formylglutamate amidohydrolase [Capsulimonadaceae bacterium]|nr:N-formylglutamate amidohydrolase [Capsulimonadaceae bacterium]